MKVGVVGLGAMGSAMAINLHKAGMLTAVWNRTPERTVFVAKETGIQQAQDLSALASVCEVILLSVSADEDVLAVIGDLLPSCKADTTIIDTSTVSASTARQVETLLKAKGIHFLDAPVSGGVEGARKGELSMMVGGDTGVLNRVRPALEAISSQIVHMGPVGNGQATKAVNQIMAAGINQAVTEALAFGQAMGLPMEKVIDVVSGGAAGNWFLAHRGNSMLAGDYKPGFRIVLHDKDLGICEAMANEKSMTLPVVASIRRSYRQLIDEGYGDDDISGLYRLKCDR